ncbi:MAG: NAD(P)H-dependent oxidoreductase [Eubacterium sp.]|nr:NAD(P)H-dependent oxidoreductase [Eubacterium sp.]
MKTLIVYYSAVNGNTKRIAEMIQNKTKCDMARIELVKDYTGTHEEIVSQGKREVEAGFMPEIKTLRLDIAEYNRVIVGTPTWWYTMAPAVFTFMKQTNFSGKTVVLFHTHGGWPGHTLEDMEALCDGAEIQSSFSVQFDSDGGNELITAPSKIEKWINTL